MPDTINLRDAAAALDSAREAVTEAEAAFPLVMLGLFALMVLVGLVLWLMGGKLAHGACVVSGLVLGAVVGWLIGASLADQGAYLLPLVLGGSIIGALLAGLLFRVWIAIVGAAVLAAVVPIASLIWQGATVEAVTFDRSAVVDRTMADGEDGQRRSLLKRVNSGLNAMYEQIADDATAWWEQLGTGGRRIVYLGVIVGAVAGLLLGLLLPKLSAALQSALAGAVLIYTGGLGLARWQFGDETAFLPDSARGALVCLGLITVLGVVIQWTLFRRRADK